jgi:hypothetical protein
MRMHKVASSWFINIINWWCTEPQMWNTMCCCFHVRIIYAGKISVIVCSTDEDLRPVFKKNVNNFPNRSYVSPTPFSTISFFLISLKILLLPLWLVLLQCHFLYNNSNKMLEFGKYSRAETWTLYKLGGSFSTCISLNIKIINLNTV